MIRAKAKALTLKGKFQNKVQKGQLQNASVIRSMMIEGASTKISSRLHPEISAVKFIAKRMSLTYD